MTHRASQVAVMLACACVLIAACSDSSKPSRNHASKDSGTPAKSGHHDASIAKDAGLGATDAGRPDAGFEPMVVGQTDPLPKPRFAFKAGYLDQEQVWLIGASDELRQVPSGEISPVWASSCGFSGGTGTYIEGQGRFGELLFDPSGRYLLFSETLECNTSGEQRSRVLAYELASGTTRAVLETEKRPEMAASRGGVAVYVDQVADQFPPQQTPDDPLPDVFVFADGAFERVAVPKALGVRMSGWQHVYIEKLGDRTLLLANNVAPLERASGKWRRATRPKPGEFFSIDAKGKVSTIGPLAGVKGILHGAVVPPVK